MSANNFIFIEQLKKGWRVGMKDADTGSLLGKRDIYKDLEKACHVAQAMVDWEGVEYGIVFKFKEELK